MTSMYTPITFLLDGDSAMGAFQEEIEERVRGEEPELPGFASRGHETSRRRVRAWGPTVSGSVHYSDDRHWWTPVAGSDVQGFDRRRFTVTAYSGGEHGQPFFFTDEVEAINTYVGLVSILTGYGEFTPHGWEWDETKSALRRVEEAAS